LNNENSMGPMSPLKTMFLSRYLKSEHERLLNSLIKDEVMRGQEMTMVTLAAHVTSIVEFAKRHTPLSDEEIRLLIVGLVDRHIMSVGTRMKEETEAAAKEMKQ